jgi:hypothetical protein
MCCRCCNGTGKKIVGKRTVGKMNKVYEKSGQAKYTNRPSPALPANNFCGLRRKGNDGMFWRSTPNKNGVCSWRKI